MVGTTVPVASTSAPSIWDVAGPPCAAIPDAVGCAFGASLTASAFVVEAGGGASGLRRTTAVRNGLFGTEDVVTQAPS